jgi:23S rRNA G2445 N2-methylase RlmL
MRFFCRVTAGLEDLAAFDLQERLPDIAIQEVAWRSIHFSLEDPVRRVLDIPTVDDVYLFLDEMTEVGHTRDELARIREFTQGLPFDNALKAMALFRAPSTPNHLYVSVSRLGKHNYSTTEIQELFSQTLAEAYGWQAAESFPEANINLRVIIEHGSILVGLSLATEPLHRRGYKVCHIPGALKPPVAHLMARLLGLQPGMTVMDPMCGTGTLLIEAKMAQPDVSVYGTDSDPAAVGCARQNWQAAFGDGKAELIATDLRAILAAGPKIDRFITNPPWGRQVAAMPDFAIYAELLDLMARRGKEDALLAVITDQTEELLAAVEGHANLELLFGRQISLFGAYPFICLIDGRSWTGDGPGSFEAGLVKLIAQKGKWQPYP